MNTISTVKQEFMQAMQEGRQPNCPYCQKPLEVEVSQFEHCLWRWSCDKQRFEKTKYSEGEDPKCVECGSRNDDFVAFTSEVSGLCAKLGLDY